MAKLVLWLTFTSQELVIQIVWLLTLINFVSVFLIEKIERKVKTQSYSTVHKGLWQENTKSWSLTGKCLAMFRKPGVGQWTHSKKHRHTIKAQTEASVVLGRNITLNQLKVICLWKPYKIISLHHHPWRDKICISLKRLCFIIT